MEIGGLNDKGNAGATDSSKRRLRKKICLKKSIECRQKRRSRENLERTGWRSEYNLSMDYTFREETSGH